MSSNLVTFFVPGEPVAQPRVKARAFGRQARVYTPDTADKWKSEVKSMTRVKMDVTQGPYDLGLMFRMLRPKAHYRTGRNAQKLRDAAPVLHTKKPDVDNLAKAVIDAMVDSGRVDDDSFLVYLAVSKVWVCSDPGVSVRFQPLYRL